MGLTAASAAGRLLPQALRSALAVTRQTAVRSRTETVTVAPFATSVTPVPAAWLRTAHATSHEEGGGGRGGGGEGRGGGGGEGEGGGGRGGGGGGGRGGGKEGGGGRGEKREERGRCQGPSCRCEDLVGLWVTDRGWDRRSEVESTSGKRSLSRARGSQPGHLGGRAGRRRPPLFGLSPR